LPEMGASGLGTSLTTVCSLVPKTPANMIACILLILNLNYAD